MQLAYSNRREFLRKDGTRGGGICFHNSLICPFMVHPWLNHGTTMAHLWRIHGGTTTHSWRYQVPIMAHEYIYATAAKTPIAGDP